jgi:hypothetical protein
MRHIESFRLHWDRDYGIDHRQGWTIEVNGIVVAELLPFDDALGLLKQWLAEEET